MQTVTLTQPLQMLQLMLTHGDTEELQMLLTFTMLHS